MENIIKKIKNYNVLLVDDEEEIRKGMEALLRKFFSHRLKTLQLIHNQN
jgi:CheY-like chemotaxis protein